MRILSGFKAALRKSEAAVVIERLLDVQAAAGLFDERPAAIANKLVAVVWDRNPAVFSTGAGLSQKYALAAAALSGGVTAMQRAGDANAQASFVICLGSLFQKLYLLRDAVALSALDLGLIKAAGTVYAQVLALPSTADPMHVRETASTQERASNGVQRPVKSSVKEIWDVRPGTD